MSNNTESAVPESGASKTLSTGAKEFVPSFVQPIFVAIPPSTSGLVAQQDASKHRKPYGKHPKKMTQNRHQSPKKAEAANLSNPELWPSLSQVATTNTASSSKAAESNAASTGASGVEISAEEAGKSKSPQKEDPASDSGDPSANDDDIESASQKAATKAASWVAMAAVPGDAANSSNSNSARGARGREATGRGAAGARGRGRGRGRGGDAAAAPIPVAVNGPHGPAFSGYVIPPNAVGAMPVFLPQDPAALRERIVKQVEYYFSNDNLAQDIFLRKNMDDEGWVHVSILLDFPRVRRLTLDPNVLLGSLSESTAVEINDYWLRKRENWKGFVLPEELREPRVPDTWQPPALPVLPAMPLPIVANAMPGAFGHAVVGDAADATSDAEDAAAESDTPATGWGSIVQKLKAESKKVPVAAAAAAAGTSTAATAATAKSAVAKTTAPPTGKASGASKQRGTTPPQQGSSASKRGGGGGSPSRSGASSGASLSSRASSAVTKGAASGGGRGDKVAAHGSTASAQRATSAASTAAASSAAGGSAGDRNHQKNASPHAPRGTANSTAANDATGANADDGAANASWTQVVVGRRRKGDRGRVGVTGASSGGGGGGGGGAAQQHRVSTHRPKRSSEFSADDAEAMATSFDFISVVMSGNDGKNDAAWNVVSSDSAWGPDEDEEAVAATSAASGGERATGDGTGTVSKQANVGWVALRHGDFDAHDALPRGVTAETLAQHGFSKQPYSEFRAECLSQHRVGLETAGMNLLYQFWSRYLLKAFEVDMYRDFVRQAAEDSASGARHGVSKLFAFYTASLERNFRRLVFDDFQADAVREHRNGFNDGLVQLAAFVKYRRLHASVDVSPEAQALLDTRSKISTVGTTSPAKRAGPVPEKKQQKPKGSPSKGASKKAAPSAAGDAVAASSEKAAAKSTN